MEVAMRFQHFAALVAALILTGCTGYVAVDTTPTASEPPTGEPRKSKPHNTAHLKIPPGHLPPPGQCRIWIPGRPPGHQPRAGRCASLKREVPAGAWLVYRASKDKRDVKIWVYDSVHRDEVVAVWRYDTAAEHFVLEE
jgi:hypothetical protein